MKKTFKKYFIPHEGNDHKPHFLHEWNALMLATLIVGIFLATSLGQYVVLQNSNQMAAVITSRVVELTNDDRTDNNLTKLAVNDTLVRVAQLKANDMADKSYFAHTSPEGKSPWHWFRQGGYNFRYAGENLAVHFSDSRAVQNAWMDSPTHRANILNDRFTEIGIATARGTYKGDATTFVVQVFGNPLGGTTAPTLITPTQPTNTQEETSAEDTNEEAQLQELQRQLQELQEQLATAGPTSVLGEESEVVLGATAEAQGLENETFMAVENTPDGLQEITPTLDVETVKVKDTVSLPQQVAASPNTTLKYIYLILGIIILIPLLGMIFIECKRHHLKHVGYGIMLLALIGLLLYISQTNLLFDQVRIL